MPRRLEEILPEGVEKSPEFAQALTHSSAVRNANASNERLEFLGDAVLQLVTTELIYRRYPDLDEGMLTRLRAAVVSRSALQRLGGELGLGRRVVVGQADAMTQALVANALEAVIGAIFLVKGYSGAGDFVSELVGESLEAASQDQVHGDYKSVLHQSLAKLHLDPPSYRVEWSGPDHRRWYRITIVIAGGIEATGEGRSRKVAEQEACRLAIIETGKRASQAGT